MVCIRVPVVWLKVNGKAITGHNYWLTAQNPKEVPTQALKLQHQAFSVWAYLPGAQGNGGRDISGLHRSCYDAARNVNTKEDEVQLSNSSPESPCLLLLKVPLCSEYQAR